ncbi:MAG: hypothetical protein L3J32_12900 [Rhizobiaceae bacterium]|nr:hypothetical protein [Rhizobiaceae bacterium]
MTGFQKVSLAATLVYILLFLFLLFTPEFIFWIFQIEGSETADFIARRAAMLFLGLAIIAYFGRHSPNSIMRQAVSLGMGVSMVALAVLGAFEFFRGFSGPGIWFAILAETGFAIAYLSIWYTNRTRIDSP